MSSLKSDEIVTLYNEQRRIFCSKCIDTKLVIPCRGYKCNNLRERSRKKCGHHRACIYCHFSLWLFNCNICNKNCCHKCSNNTVVCKQCIIDQEHKSKRKLLSSLLSFSSNIINIISEYSVGMAAICNRIKCNKEIITNYMFDFENKVDFKGNKISYYTPIHTESDRRIFCSKCVSLNFVKYCQISGCINMDCKSICFNHSKCIICMKVLGNNYRRNQCKNCKITMYFCDKCVSKSLCKQCVISDEHYQISKAILYSVGNDINIINDVNLNMIKLIAIYSTGFITKCTKLGCNEIIIVNNRYEFLHESVDYKGNKISHYAPREQQFKSLKCNGMRLIYGKQRRVFCSICVKKELVIKCEICNIPTVNLRMMFSDKYIKFNLINNNGIENVCGHHFKCPQCYLSMLPWNYLLCKICNTYFCQNCATSGIGICKLCEYGIDIIQTEYESIKQSLESILCFESYIIDIISAYSVGIATICTVCNTEIVTNNMFEFVFLQIDVNGNKISYYELIYPQQMISMYSIKNRMQVLCSQCSDTKLNKHRYVEIKDAKIAAKIAEMLKQKINGTYIQ